MLERLDTIDWHSLKHAYGPADDVPELLRSLLIDDKVVRNKIMHELFSNVTHQGTVYEATIYVVPVLYELLESKATPMKSDIACLIGEIGNGYGYYQVHGPLFEYMDTMDHQRSLWNRIFRIRPKVRTYKQEIANEESITDRVLAEVHKRFDLLLPYLNDPDSYTRAAVAGAMGRYPDKRDIFVPLLTERQTTETDHEVQSAIMNALESLDRTNPSRP